MQAQNFKLTVHPDAPPHPMEAATGLYLAAHRDMMDVDYVAAVNGGTLQADEPYHLDASTLYSTMQPFRDEVDRLRTPAKFGEHLRGEVYGFPFECVVSITTQHGLYLACRTALPVDTHRTGPLDRLAVRRGYDLELAAAAYLMKQQGRTFRSYGIFWCTETTCRRLDLGEAVIKAACALLPEAMSAYADRIHGKRHVKIPNVLSNALPDIEHASPELLLTSNVVRELPPESLARRFKAKKQRRFHALRRESADEIFRLYFPEPGEEVMVATNGDTDCYHMALAFMEAAKEQPLEIFFTTWAMSREVADDMCERMKTVWHGIPVTQIVSTLFKGRYRSQYAQLINQFSRSGGRVIIVNQHAKIFCCRTASHYLCFVTSANMDTNLHLETYTIYNDRDTYEFWRELIRFYEHRIAASS